MKRVDNKVVLVTGGAIGVVREVSILLAIEGAKVAVTDIHEVEGKTLVEEIIQSGGVAKFWHLDVANENEVENVFAEVARELGKLDATVNYAGIAITHKPTHKSSEK